MVEFSFLQSLSLPIIFTLTFVFVIFFYITGFTIKKRQISNKSKIAKVELGTLNGTLLGLLSLLLAFTFSLSSSRFDTRRNMVIEEANDIGTAFLRTKLYPDSVKTQLTSLFKEYIKSRIAYHEAGSDISSTYFHYNNANTISNKIWNVVAEDAKTDIIGTRSRMMIPALNDMIDITQSRLAEAEAKIPDSILYLLFLLCCCSGFLLGYENKVKLDWIVLIFLALTLSATIFTILDLDRSRQGLIVLKTQNDKINSLLELVNQD